MNENDICSLSRFLLINALKKNYKIYEKILAIILNKLNSLSKKDDTLKAWMLGRILQAAYYIGDDRVIANTKTELETLLIKTDMPHDSFNAWAWAYMVSCDSETYYQYKNNMLTAVLKLTEKYKSKLADGYKRNDAILQNLATDIIWAWVMALQAVAKSKDKETYDFILFQIKSMAVESTISESLSINLTPDDYPAWAFAIMRISAAEMRDEVLYNSLELPLNKFLQLAVEHKRDDEIALAELNAILATEKRILFQL